MSDSKSVWRRIVSDIFRDVLDPVVLKFSALSILAASAFIMLIGHIVLDLGIHSILSLSTIEKWLPTSVGVDTGAISFLLSVLLFSFAMPLIATTLFPLTAFFQLLLAEPFALAFQRKYYPENSPGASSLSTNILILVKWTLVKLIMFIALLPVLHIPALGLAVHIFLLTLWITVIYFEVVARRYLTSRGYWRVFRQNFHNLCIISVWAVVANYALMWLLGFFGLVLPALRPLILLIIVALNITANYLLMAEFIRYFNRSHMVAAGEQTPNPSVNTDAAR